jgi:excisionase family DNA binding protein
MAAVRERPGSGADPRKNRNREPRFDGAGPVDDPPDRFDGSKRLRKPQRLLSVRESAEILNTSEKTVYRRIDDGQLRAIKIGRLWRIDPRDLEDFIRDHRK